jgi:dihydrofolate synthase/folylpolyglutamate synthase
MLRDKDPETVAAALGDTVDVWYAAGLSGSRGQDGEGIATHLRRLFPARPVSVHADVNAAWRAARSAARSGDRIVALGSFLTAREVLNLET